MGIKQIVEPGMNIIEMNKKGAIDRIVGMSKNTSTDTVEFRQKVNAAIHDALNHLLGGCVRFPEQGLVASSVARKARVNHRGTSYTVDVFHFFDLDIDVLKTQTGLEFVQQLTSDKVDEMNTAFHSLSRNNL